MTLATSTAVGGEGNWIGSFLGDFRVQVGIIFYQTKSSGWNLGEGMEVGDDRIPYIPS